MLLKVLEMGRIEKVDNETNEQSEGVLVCEPLLTKAIE